MGEVFRNKYGNSELAHIYDDLRAVGVRLEQYLDTNTGLTIEELKRVDKSITVMKVGFKLLKKVLKKQSVLSNVIEMRKNQGY